MIQVSFPVTHGSLSQLYFLFQSPVNVRKGPLIVTIKVKKVEHLCAVVLLSHVSFDGM